MLPPALLLLLAGWAVAQLVSIPTAKATPPAKPTFFNSRAGRLKSSIYSRIEGVDIVFIFTVPFLVGWFIF